MKAQSPYENSLRTVCGQIGLSLLIFLGLINTLPIATSFLTALFYATLSEGMAILLSGIVQGVMYFVIFTVPAVILRHRLRHKGFDEPFGHRKGVHPDLLLIIPAALMLVFCTAFLNSWLLRWLPAPSPLPTEVMGWQAIAAAVFTTAVVPALCEEFLFRGAIQSALIPYGRGFSVVASALLFGLMHQNVRQILYTTMAGLVLGYIYLRTRSIWYGVIVHFANNLMSVADTVIASNWEEQSAGMISGVIYLCIFVLGVVSVVCLLLLDERKRKNKFKNGSFGVILEPHDGYMRYPVSEERTVRLFWTPTMLVFGVLCACLIASSVAITSLLDLIVRLLDLGGMFL